MGVQDPDIRPGTTIGGRRVDSAEVRIGQGAVRAVVWTG
jgi:hypothetical protein